MPRPTGAGLTELCAPQAYCCTLSIWYSRNHNGVQHKGLQSLAVQSLQLAVLDIYPESGGMFHVWGTTSEGASVLIRIQDFSPHFCITAPTLEVPWHSALCSRSSTPCLAEVLLA